MMTRGNKAGMNTLSHLKCIILATVCDVHMNVSAEDVDSPVVDKMYTNVTCKTQSCQYMALQMDELGPPAPELCQIVSETDEVVHLLRMMC